MYDRLYTQMTAPVTLTDAEQFSAEQGHSGGEMLAQCCSVEIQASPSPRQAECALKSASERLFELRKPCPNRWQFPVNNLLVAGVNFGLSMPRSPAKKHLFSARHYLERMQHLGQSQICRGVPELFLAISRDSTLGQTLRSVRR